MSRLFTIDFGDNPDFSAEEGTQGLWDSLGEHERLVLRSTDAHMEKHNSIFKIKLAEGSTMQTPDKILSEGKEEEVIKSKIQGDIATYSDPNWWKTSTNPEEVIESHIVEIFGANPQEGIWAEIVKEMPNLGSPGYVDAGMKRVINNYKANKGNNISDEMNSVFIQIEEMEKALKVGQRYKKDTQKAEDKLENN